MINDYLLKNRFLHNHAVNLNLFEHGQASLMTTNVIMARQAITALSNTDGDNQGCPGLVVEEREKTSEHQ